MKRLLFAGSAGLLVGALLMTAAVVFTAPVQAQPALTRCDFTDIDPITQQPCIAIGSFASPANELVDFTSDIPGATMFSLFGTEAPGALVTDPNSVIKFTDQMAGTYTITQAPVPGFKSWWLACDGRFDAARLVVNGPTSITLTVGPGDFVTCDFVNVRHELVVVKSATPADGTDFSFTDGAGGFALDDAVPDDADGVASQITLTAPGSRNPFDPSSVTVAETVPQGWALDAIDCIESPTTDPAGDFTDVDVDVAAGSVTATFGELYSKTVTCTFTNSALPADGYAPHANGTPVCIESPIVQGASEAADLGVANEFRTTDGSRYLVITGKPTCSFNCAAGLDINCDGVLGDSCPAGLDLSRVRDVGTCLALFTPDPSPATPAPAAPATAATSAGSGSAGAAPVLASTGSSTDLLMRAALGLVAVGAGTTAAGARRGRYHRR